MKASLALFLLVNLVSASVIISSLSTEAAPRVSLTVLVNSTSEPGHLFARYSSGLFSDGVVESTDLETLKESNVIYMNNSQATLKFSSNSYSVGNSTDEGPTLIGESFGQLNYAPWWDYSFESRRTVTVVDQAGVENENMPVSLAVSFDPNEAYINSLRLRYWDGESHIEVPYEITSQTLNGNYYTQVTLLFLANVSASSVSPYQLYYSSANQGTQSYSLMDVSTDETHLTINDTITASFRLGNMTGEGEIDSFVINGTELAFYNASGERGLASFEMFSTNYGIMRPTDNRNDESILFQELTVEERTPIRTRIRRTSFMRGTLNEYFTFYHNSPYFVKETEFFPFETITVPSNSYGGIIEPDSAVLAAAHNNTYTWGGIGSRLPIYNWTTAYTSTGGVGFIPLESTLTPTDEYLLSNRIAISYNNTDTSSISLTANRYDFRTALVGFLGSTDMDSWQKRLSTNLVAGVSDAEAELLPQLFSGPIRSRILYQPLSDSSLDVFKIISLSAYRPDVKTKSWFFPKSSFELPVSNYEFNLTTDEAVIAPSADEIVTFSGENKTLSSFVGAALINNTFSFASEGAALLDFGYDNGVLSLNAQENMDFVAKTPLYRKTYTHPTMAQNLLIRNGAIQHFNESMMFSDKVIFEDSSSSAYFSYYPTNATIASLFVNATPFAQGWYNCSLNRNTLLNFTGSNTTIIPMSFFRTGNNTLTCTGGNTSFEVDSIDLKLTTVANPSYAWDGSWAFVPLIIDWHRNNSAFATVSIDAAAYGLSDKNLRVLDSNLKELPVISNSFNTTLQPFRQNIHYLAYSDSEIYSGPQIEGAEIVYPNIDLGIEGSFSPRAKSPFGGIDSEEYPVKIMPAVSISGSAEKTFVDTKTGTGAIFRLVIWP